MDLDRLTKIAAWLALCTIVFVTVSPIDWRPRDIMSVDTDRGLSFMIMALLFVAAYPKRFWLCAILLVCGAGAIELLQYLSPTRHARLEDASVKAIGAAMGATIAFVVIKVRQMFGTGVGWRPARYSARGRGGSVFANDYLGALASRPTPPASSLSAEPGLEAVEEAEL